MKKNLTEANFNAEVSQATTPVIVHFTAFWCGPCRMQEPIMDDVSNAEGDNLLIGSVNVDKCPGLVSQFAVKAVPLLIFFQGGKERDRVTGVQSIRDIGKRLKKLNHPISHRLQ